MKSVELTIPTEVLVRDYLELNSSYKVASKHNVSATAVKRLLKEAGVLRTQNEAASLRNLRNPNCGKYERSDAHIKNLSDLASKRTGEANHFFGKTHTNEVKAKLSAKAKERTGKRNPNFKDGSYIRRPRDYKIREFEIVRNVAFNRDSYTCIYCKTVGGHLHGHHILPYWVMPSAFLDSDNVITVCTSCHFKVAHQGNWHKFDVSLVTSALCEKYSIDRERLNELTSFS